MKQKKPSKRGRPPGSKNKKGKVTTKTASIDKGKEAKPKAKPMIPMIECEFCEYSFAEALGRYGCPNCEGGPDEREPNERTLGGTLMGFMATRHSKARSVLFTYAITPTFGVAGPEQDLRNKLDKNAGWKGHTVWTDGEKVWLEPYDG